MPISKEGNLYYTQDQFEIARFQSSALEYAKANGYPLVKTGVYYTHKDHDSFVFKQDGSFYWNSRGIQGGALELLTKVENKDWTESVLILAGENPTSQTIELSKYIKKEQTGVDTTPVPFVLPEKATDYHRAFAYLTKIRCIDSQVLSKLLAYKKFYESIPNHNIVFPFVNNAGEIVGAFQKGTYTKVPFAGMVTGSDRMSGYFCFGGNPKADTLCVFEAAIDAISYADLLKREGRTDYYDGRYYLAVGGNGDQNVDVFLSGHPNVERIILCHDNDTAGHRMADTLSERLKSMDYKVQRSVPENVDFNDDLKMIVGKERSQEKTEVIEFQSELGGG